MTAGPLRILLVEDNSADAKLLEYELRRGGIEFRSVRVETESEFLAALTTEPDIVLCDWQLPQFDSLQALKLLHAKQPDIPFIVVSGSIGQEAAINMMKQGAADYLLKDCLDRLVPAVEQALEKRAIRLSAIRATEALRQSESRLADAQRIARLGSWGWEPISGKVWWSDAIYALYGLDPTMAAPSLDTFLRILHPDDRPIALARVERVLASFCADSLNTNNASLLDEDAFAQDFRVIRPDGSRIWIHSRARVTRDLTGQTILVEGSDQDITERKQHEAMIQASEERYRRLLEVLPNAVFINCGDEIVFCNPSCVRLFGATQGDEILGRSPFEFFHPDFHATIRQRIDLMSVKCRSVPEIEERIVRIDGNAVPVQVVATPIKDNGVDAVLVVLSDLTERKRLEEQFLQAQKMEAIGQMAGGVAHDFNNLLTVINGYAEVLHTKLSDNDDLAQYVTCIHEAGERAAGLTAQLLAFSRKSIIAPRVLDVNELIDHLGKMLHRLIAEDITFSTRLDPELSRVKVDPGQLEQVLINLAVNARDAMPRGGHLTIETRQFELSVNDVSGTELKAGSHVQILVTDTGAGIPKEIQSRMFEPFFTTKDVGKGTGLGLATVYAILQRAGGCINVDSEPGRGTTFLILLPAVMEELSVVPAQLPQPIAPRGSETILVVEDEPAVLRLVEFVLESHGYHVITAANGHAAIAITESHTGAIDLLLTDVVMPGMNGREVAEAVRRRWPKLSVLYASGYTADTIVRYGVESEASAFLEKPFTPLTLTRKVRETLDRQFRNERAGEAAEVANVVRLQFGHPLDRDGSVIEPLKHSRPDAP